MCNYFETPRDQIGRWRCFRVPRTERLCVYLSPLDWELFGRIAADADIAPAELLCRELQSAFVCYATRRKLPVLMDRPAWGTMSVYYIRVDLATRSIVTELAQACQSTVSTVVRSVIGGLIESSKTTD